MDVHGYVTASDVRQALRAIYREDPETNLQRSLLHALADDLKPVDAQGCWRSGSLFVILGILLVAILGVFLYFSLGVNG